MNSITILAVAAVLTLSSGMARADLLQANFTIQVTSAAPTGPFTSVPELIDGVAVFDDDATNATSSAQSAAFNAFEFTGGAYQLSIPALGISSPSVGVEMDSNNPDAMPNADIFELSTKHNAISYQLSIGWPLGSMGGLNVPSKDVLNAPFSLSDFRVVDWNFNVLLTGKVTSFHVSAIPEARTSVILVVGMLTPLVGVVRRHRRIAGNKAVRN